MFTRNYIILNDLICEIEKSFCEFVSCEKNSKLRFVYAFE